MWKVKKLSKTFNYYHNFDHILWRHRNDKQQGNWLSWIMVHTQQAKLSLFENFTTWTSLDAPPNKHAVTINYSNTLPVPTCVPVYSEYFFTDFVKSISQLSPAFTARQDIHNSYSWILQLLYLPYRLCSSVADRVKGVRGWHHEVVQLN